jgi:hypothetical protein
VPGNSISVEAGGAFALVCALAASIGVSHEVAGEAAVVASPLEEVLGVGVLHRGQFSKAFE